MKIIEKGKGTWRPVAATTSVKIEILTLAYNMWQDSRRNRYLRRNPETISELLVLWETGLYNLTSLQNTTGITRKTIRAWLTGRVDFTKPQVRGQVKPEHLKLIINRLTDELQQGDQGREKFIDRLVAEGSTSYLIRAIFGEENTRNDDQPVRTTIRPDDEGHPEERQGVGGPEHQDQTPDGPGEGEEEPEPVDPGPVQGPAASDQPAESGTVEDEGVESEYSRVVAAKGRVSDRNDSENEGAEWDPLEDYAPDLEGDSFLFGGQDSGTSERLPGFPGFGEDFEYLAPPEP